MIKRCLYCYQPIEENCDYHEKCRLAFFGDRSDVLVPYAYNELKDLAKNVIRQSVTVPGVQTKLSLKLEKNVGADRLTLVGYKGDYILKPPTEKYANLPENEDLIMKMAEYFDIKTVPHSLIRLKSGELSYITRRIDRLKGKKIHMEDFCQLSGKLTVNKYKSSSEALGRILFKYSSKPIMESIELFKIILFSFLVGNNDMHLKNFSLIYNKDEIKLAPAYDLLAVRLVIPKYKDDDELALSIAGKKKNIGKKQFYSLGEKYMLNTQQIDYVFTKFSQQLSKCCELIEVSFLPKGMQEELINLLKERFSRILI